MCQSCYVSHAYRKVRARAPLRRSLCGSSAFHWRFSLLRWWLHQAMRHALACCGMRLCSGVACMPEILQAAWKAKVGSGVWHDELDQMMSLICMMS
jgi:hypothetical protein